jgi:hypothetical protein
MLNSLFIQLITLLNFFSITYIIFLFFIFGYLEIVTESFIVLSLISIFTIGLSSNIRNIYISTPNNIKIKNNILLRILIGIIAGLICVVITYLFIGESHILFHSSIIFLTVTNWILELLIARYEKINIFKINHLTNNFFLFFGSLLLIYSKNILILPLLLFSISLLNFFIFRNFFINIFRNKLVINKIFETLGFASTLFKQIANFVARYLIFILIGKFQASYLFIGFALGSFFGTIFDISYGALFLKKIKNKTIFINISFIIYAIVIFFFIIFVKAFLYIEKEYYNVLLNTSIFSVCGSYFLILALDKRQLFFEKKKNRTIFYKADIFLYSSNFLIIPILYYYNPQYLSITYMLSSLFYYFIYVIYFPNVYKKIS